jgi:hypothetical protein
VRASTTACVTNQNSLHYLIPILYVFHAFRLRLTSHIGSFAPSTIGSMLHRFTSSVNDLMALCSRATSKLATLLVAQNCQPITGCAIRSICTPRLRQSRLPRTKNLSGVGCHGYTGAVCIPERFGPADFDVALIRSHNPLTSALDIRYLMR